LAFDECAVERRLEDWGVVAGEFFMGNELFITLESGECSQFGRLPSSKSGQPSFPFPLFERRVNDRERIIFVLSQARN
jgi:hypothetical protein